MARPTGCLQGVIGGVGHYVVVHGLGIALVWMLSEATYTGGPTGSPLLTYLFLLGFAQLPLTVALLLFLAIKRLWWDWLTVFILALVMAGLTTLVLVFVGIPYA